MKTIGAREAKARFSALLREVEHGETIVITRRGVPVAQLTPLRPAQRTGADVAAAIREWEQFRDEHDIALGGDATIRELIEEGRD